jgi:hypothetical protein
MGKEKKKERKEKKRKNRYISYIHCNSHESYSMIIMRNDADKIGSEGRFRQNIAFPKALIGAPLISKS